MWAVGRHKVLQNSAVNMASSQQYILMGLFTVVQRTPGGLMIEKSGHGKADLQLQKMLIK